MYCRDWISAVGGKDGRDAYVVAVGQRRGWVGDPHVGRVEGDEGGDARGALRLSKSLHHARPDLAGVGDGAEQGGRVERGVGAEGVLGGRGVAGPEAVGVAADNLREAGVARADVGTEAFGGILIEDDGPVVPAAVDPAAPGGHQGDENAVGGGAVDGPVDVLEVGLIGLQGVGVVERELAVEIGECGAVELGDDDGLDDVEAFAGAVLEVVVDVAAVQAVEELPRRVGLPEERLPAVGPGQISAVARCRDGKVCP